MRTIRFLTCGLVVALTSTSSHAVSIVFGQDPASVDAASDPAPESKDCANQEASPDSDSSATDDDGSGMGSTGYLPHLRAHETSTLPKLRTCGPDEGSLSRGYLRFLKPWRTARAMTISLVSTRPLGVAIRPSQHGIHAPPF